MHSGRKALSQSNLRTCPLTFTNLIFSTASCPSVNLTPALLSLIFPIETGYRPERSMPFSTSTESLRTAAGTSPSCVYTKIFLSNLPGFIFRFAVWFLRCLDYVGWLPKFLTNEVSPFHGSMIITSMGSLGIPPIYHHLYDFGNLPVFLAYGSKQTELALDAEGNVTKKKYVELKAVTDERICDGFYYASCFKIIRRCFENPECLLTPPEQVFEDVD